MKGKSGGKMMGGGKMGSGKKVKMGAGNASPSKGGKGVGDCGMPRRGM